MLVSIVVVNANGLHFLTECLSALESVSYKSTEIIVVDNGSTDGSVDYLRLWEDKSRRRSIFLARNYGPAAARNIGVNNSNGDIIAFLDNDAAPLPDWLSQPCKMFVSDENIGIIQCKIVLKNNPSYLDSEGELIDDRTGFLVSRVPVGAPLSESSSDVVELFAAKSAAMLIRKTAFDDAGGFDDSYFIYVEETDLAWRVRDAGFSIWLAPDSIVLHTSGGTALLPSLRGKRLLRYYGSRNYLLTIIKNAPRHSLLRLVLIQTSTMLILALAFLFQGRIEDAGWTLAGVASVAFRPLSAVEARRRRLSRVPETKALSNDRIVKRRSISGYLNRLRQL